MSDNSIKKNWFRRHKILTGIGVIIILIIIGSAASGGGKNQPKATATQRPTTASIQADKKIADGISLQSTGFSYSADKSRITYGFILANSQKFTGTVDITFSGVNGSLSDALVFTEKNLAAGAGDIGTATWSGRYDKYSYKVTVGSQTYSYAGSSILVND